MQKSIDKKQQIIMNDLMQNSTKKTLLKKR